MPVVEIFKNPETRVEYFLMLYFRKKFRVARFILAKVLAIFNKKQFSRSHQTPGRNSGKPGTRAKYFLML